MSILLYMDEKKFKREALNLIAEYFGEYTKKLYIRFYEDKTTETVLASLEELLIEMIGPEKTEKVLLPLRQKYFLNSKND